MLWRVCGGLPPITPPALNKERGMGESAAQLHPVLARVKQPGLFFSQCGPAGGKQPGRQGAPQMQPYPRLTLQVKRCRHLTAQHYTAHLPQDGLWIAQLSVARKSCHLPPQTHFSAWLPVTLMTRQPLRPDVGKGQAFPSFITLFPPHRINSSLNAVHSSS